MKRMLGLAAAVLVVGVMAAQVRSAAPAVVAVSLTRIASQSNSGKRAMQQLDTLKQERARELLAKQKELEEVVKQLAKAAALPAADRERIAQEDVRRRSELQQMASQANADIAAMQGRLQGELRTQIAPILADIAKQRGVDVVLNADGLAWAAPATDATNEVLQRMNAAPQ
jgi:Skp family chaperone for outer membrane proteins